MKLPFDQYITNERWKANISDIARYWDFHKRSVEDVENFWASVAKELEWFRPFDKVLDASNPPFYRWFVGGELNLSYLALDRHVRTWRKNKLALEWEGEPVDESGRPIDRRKLTYYDMWREVNRVAYMLKNNFGVRRGDRVTVYLPMIPETPITHLALFRIGAIPVPVFSGFSADALADRVNDSQSRLLITADGFWRRGRVVRLKDIVDKALEKAPSVENVLVHRRLGLKDVPMAEGRDWFWDKAIAGVPANAYVEPVPVKSDDPLVILYTSGTTGKPKGVVLSTGGLTVAMYLSNKANFNIKDDDVYWCTGDIAWAAPFDRCLLGFILGPTEVQYEGAPDFPQPDRPWSIVERYGVTVLYTSPTYVRTLMRYGEKWVIAHNTGSLRIIQLSGEPVNPEVWWWLYKFVGREKAYVASGWGQTESGVLLGLYPGLMPLPMKPGVNGVPLPGVYMDVVDESGKPAPPGVKGYLVEKPNPALAVNLWGDPQRYVETYWAKFPGWYYTGDYAIKDKDGYIWVLGRADEVIKVAGYRLSTIELESALVAHPAVAEAAVVGVPDAVKGEAPIAFVVLRQGYQGADELRKELRQHIRNTIGPIAEPSQIFFVAKLPKTRTGKIMRRLLKAVYLNAPIGDASTIEDETAIDEVKKVVEEIKREMQLR